MDLPLEESVWLLNWKKNIFIPNTNTGLIRKTLPCRRLPCSFVCVIPGKRYSIFIPVHREFTPLIPALSAEWIDSLGGAAPKPRTEVKEAGIKAGQKES